MVPMKHTQFDLVCCNYGALDAPLAMASNWVVSLRSIKVALATSCWAAPGERTFWWLSSYRALLCKITIWSQLRFSVKMIGFQTKQYRPNIFAFSGISFLNSKKMMFFWFQYRLKSWPRTPCSSWHPYGQPIAGWGQHQKSKNLQEPAGHQAVWLGTEIMAGQCVVWTSSINFLSSNWMSE